ALDHHVRLTDGVGFVVDFLSVEVHIAPVVNTSLVDEIVLAFGQHAAGATGGIVYGNDSGQAFTERFEHERRHQVNYFPWGEVLSRFFIVFLIKPAYQFFEYIAHAQVGEGWERAPFGITPFE